MKCQQMCHFVTRSQSMTCTSYNFTLRHRVLASSPGPPKNREHSVHFNLETIVRVYDHTCQKYVGHSKKRNAMPKGNELTLRIHSQLRRVYCKSHSRKISTSCSMFLCQFSVELLDLWLNGNMLSLLNSSARNVWRKKVLRRPFSQAGI